MACDECPLAASQSLSTSNGSNCCSHHLAAADHRREQDSHRRRPTERQHDRTPTTTSSSVSSRNLFIDPSLAIVETLRTPTKVLADQLARGSPPLGSEAKCRAPLEFDLTATSTARMATLVPQREDVARSTKPHAPRNAEQRGCSLVESTVIAVMSSSAGQVQRRTMTRMPMLLDFARSQHRQSRGYRHRHRR